MSALIALHSCLNILYLRRYCCDKNQFPFWSFGFCLSASQRMETWDVTRTAEWLCQIGLDKKYAITCEEKSVSGRAMLLLASGGDNQIMSALGLKMGPQAILMKALEPHLRAFKENKLETAQRSKPLKEWDIEDLCSWLRELVLPEECLTLVQTEEINGQALLLLRESGKLKESLQLKEGSWIVLEHELSVLFVERGDIKTETTTRIFTNKNTQLMPTLKLKEVAEFKEPLAAKQHSIEESLEIPPKVVLSKEEQELSLIRDSLKLDINNTKTSENTKECVVRSIFVKRGKGVNALEKLFKFIVITKEEMDKDKPRKLWSKIIEKTTEWIKLLPENDSKSFVRESGSDTFVHVPSGENLSLRDGKVVQIPLGNISDDEYKQSVFILLVDKQLLEEKKTYTFFYDKKLKNSYSIRVNAKSNYHAAFDPNSQGLDLKWSKYFRSLMTDAGESHIVACPPQADPTKVPVCSSPPKQPPRPFNNDFEGKYYMEGWVLPCWETGSKDLVTPAHELKLLRRSSNDSDEGTFKKFLFETLRFACGCLNERTNGTIHFGVADEVEGQTCGYQPREIVGTWVTDKPRYNEKLTEFIDKCFVGDSRSNVHNCIRPPVFIPVKGRNGELYSDFNVVIEVDIEPSYSICAGEIFKVGFKNLGRGKEEDLAYIRHGSQTQAIVDMKQMEDYIRNRLPKLDEERKMREQHAVIDVGKQVSQKRLYDKLKRLLCANSDVLDSSVYPILVLSKPGANMDQEFLDKTFHFIRNIDWLIIIDFDDQGSDTSGLCKVLKSGTERKFDIHEAEDYMDDTLIENITSSTNWIFANGYAKLDKKPFGFVEWNNSERKNGLSHLMKSLAKMVPGVRAVVLFLVFSNFKEYEPMADTFKDFCTCFGGPNQLTYVGENADDVTDWEAKLLQTCLKEHDIRERSVVGMSWSEFQECVQQMVKGIDRNLRYVTMASGSLCPLKNISFSNISIVSAKECEELRNLSYEERADVSSKVEKEFYSGYPVTWRNFWFTDDQKNHVLRRDNYSDLKRLIEKLHSKGSEGKVQTITVYHHIGAGASTMTRQALWDFRFEPHFPCRCAVVTKIDDSTCQEILILRRIGYGHESQALPPVLALVEDTDDRQFRELRAQVVEHALKLPKTKWPVCVFLYCKETQNPRHCYLKEMETSVYLEQRLSPKEIDWFKHKYIEMKGKFHHKDPQRDFDKYASENLISFMIMKENFKRDYVSSLVQRHLREVREDELTLLGYTSLLNLYNPYPVFASCFDTTMLSASLLRKRIFRDWVKDLTPSCRIFLREVDVSPHLGTGKAIEVVHPVLASVLLDKVAEKRNATVSQVALQFLEFLHTQGKSLTLDWLRDGAKGMLKHRKKYEYGDDIQTKFSPLIEKIVYVEVTEDGKPKATEKSIEQAAEVLKEGLDKLHDPMLAQHLARMFYVNAEFFSENKIDSCFSKAVEFCEKAISMNPHSPCLYDTMGRIYESKMNFLYGPIRKDYRVIEVEEVTRVLPLAFHAMEWFQKSMAASMDYLPESGFRGELSVMFFLLDVFRCARIFRSREGLEKLQGYLAYCQVIPFEVKKPWNDFHDGIRNLRKRYSYCMEGLTEVFAMYKGNSLEDRMLPRQIAKFKTQYLRYFGESDVEWNAQSPEERWEYNWYKINQHLAGGIFSSAFSVNCPERKPAQTLKLLNKLARNNYRESAQERYNDLLLIVVTTMALHSPYRESGRCEQKELVDEYNEMYDFVQKLYALERRDVGPKRLYAHLLKVMFLWPRKDLQLSYHRVQDFYDSLKELRERWERKCKERNDPDKILKQKFHPHITFRSETRQYTTLFYLGKGSGLDVFVHINELTEKGSLDWDNLKTKERLKRLKGVVESKNIIRVQNPLDSSKWIDVYYSSFREGGFSKEEVSFFLGFSWPQPTAFDVKYTNKDHRKQSVELGYRVLDDQLKFVPEYNDFVYFDYTWQLEKLQKKLKRIGKLRKIKEEGGKLEENQVTLAFLL